MTLKKIKLSIFTDSNFYDYINIKSYRVQHNTILKVLFSNRNINKNLKLKLNWLDLKIDYFAIIILINYKI